MTDEDYQRKINDLEKKLSKYREIEKSIIQFKHLLVKNDFPETQVTLDNKIMIDIDLHDCQWVESMMWKLFKMFSICNDHMSLLNINYEYQLVNDSYLTAHKAKRNEIIGKTVSELLGKDVFHNLIKENFDACLGGETIHFESWFDFSGTGRCYMDVFYIPFYDINGNITGVVVNSRDITERKHLESRYKKLADTDSLTGLPNRRQLKNDFEHESKRAKRFERKMALYYIDLDGFKKVNDEFGHEVGDTILQEIANILNSSLRGNEQVYRVGGDEFCLLVPEFEDKVQLENLAHRLIQQVSAFNNFDGMKINIGSSIGIAIFPDNGKNLEILSSAADQAMYLVKTSNKNDFYFVNNNFCYIK